MNLVEYTKNILPLRKKEIDRVDDFVKDSLPLFIHVYERFKINFSKKNGWPYSYFKDKNDKNNLDYSYSTNAMINFALKLLFPTSPKSSWKERDQNDHYAMKYGLLTPLMNRMNYNVIFKSITEKYKIDFAIDKILTNNFTHLLKNLNITSKTYGKNDFATLTWVLETYYDEEKPLKPNIKKYVKRLIKPIKARLKDIFNTPKEGKLFDFSDRESNIYKYYSHSLAFVKTLHLRQILIKLIRKGNLTLTQLNESDLSTSEIRQHLFNNLHKQLSFSRNTCSSFDPPQLVFCLEGVLLCEPYKYLGLEQLITDVISTITEHQKNNCNLYPVDSILSNEQGFALFPLTVECFSSLLRIVERIMMDPLYLSIRDQVKIIFEKYIKWIYSERISFDSSYSNKSFTAYGWKSEYTNIKDCIHLWETSQILLFLGHYKAFLERDTELEIYKFGNFKVENDRYENNIELKDYMPKKKSSWVDWDPKFKATDSNDYKPYSYIKKHIIDPRVTQVNGNDKKQFSLLLYGPPGTAKTTIAELIAVTLHYPLLTITPSDFIVSGDQQVEAQTKAIFDCLEILDNHVILFDEIDRLILDRSSEYYMNQNDMFQFMTPSMLPKIRNLRKKEKSIFIIATNYAERIDAAIKRRGRIDGKILLLPPDKNQIKNSIKLKIKKTTKNIKLKSINPKGILTISEIKDIIENLNKDSTNLTSTVNKINTFENFEFDPKQYISRFVSEKLSNEFIEYLKCNNEKKEKDNVKAKFKKTIKPFIKDELLTEFKLVCSLYKELTSNEIKTNPKYAELEPFIELLISS